MRSERDALLCQHHDEFCGLAKNSGGRSSLWQQLFTLAATREFSLNVVGLRAATEDSGLIGAGAWTTAKAWNSQTNSLRECPLHSETSRTARKIATDSKGSMRGVHSRLRRHSTHLRSGHRPARCTPAGKFKVSWAARRGNPILGT